VTSLATRTPFAAIPPEAAEVLRPVLPGLADETIATIAREVPDYKRAMSGAFGQTVRLGVEVAFNRFVDLVVDPDADAAGARETYVDLGRGEFRAGRSLDALLAAYRVGARLAWRRFVAAGTEGGLDPEIIFVLGEAIFAYIDELSAESAEGYAEEQSAAAGESQRRRRRLVRLLVQEPPPAAEAVRTAAQAAGWPLPRTLGAVVAGEAEQGAADEEILDAIATRLARRLGSGAIGAAVDGAACVLLPDPAAPGRRRQLEAALGENRAALGPAGAWTEAAASLRRARSAYRLPAADALVVAEDRLADLLLRADPPLAADLAAARLAPLAGLAPAARTRLEETLRAWLDRPGQVQAVAATLGVHPQTVRYRVRQLRDLFGARLDDPDARFELLLALRVG
jgi:hypothetical protein